MRELTGRLAGYLVLGVLVGALVIYTFNQLDGLFGGNEDAATVTNSNNRIQLHEASKRWRLKLEVAERHIQQQSSANHALANDLRAALANGTRTDTAEVQGEIANADSTAFIQCSVALLTCQQRATSAEHDADSLKTALQRQLKVTDHKCGVSIGFGPSISDKVRLSGNVTLGCRVFRLPLLP